MPTSEKTKQKLEKEVYHVSTVLRGNQVSATGTWTCYARHKFILYTFQDFGYISIYLDTELQEMKPKLHSTYRVLDFHKIPNPALIGFDTRWINPKNYVCT